MHARFASVACAAAALAAPGLAQLVHPVSQARQVSGTASATDTGSGTLHDADSTAAADFAPFVASATAQVSLTGALGEAGATQDSSIGGDSIVAVGTHFANAAAYEVDASGQGTGSSDFAVTFDTLLTNTYTLAGSIEAFENGTSFAILEDTGGTLVRWDAFGPSDMIPVAASGTLPPGRYTLRALTGGTTQGVPLFFEHSAGTFDVTLRLTSTVPSFCDASDGALAFCPCGNAGDPDTGCDIQQATGGVRLDLVNQQTSPLNRATVQCYGFPPAFAAGTVVLRGPTLEPTPVVFGDGLRCVGIPLVRVHAAFADTGVSTHTFGHGVGADDFHYQAWFRNTPAMFCTPNAFNLSNGRTLTW